MKIEYKGISGTVYVIDEEKIARGGEGSIHNIQNNVTQVAKIFKTEYRNREREEKLILMVQTKMSEDLLEQITWPQDVIYDSMGFAGYIMPKLKSTDVITAVYNNENGVTYDCKKRLLTAMNLCVAVQNIHEMGQVCGDLNPQNICINLDENDRKNVFHITMVDADSYHISADGKTYRCEVGLAEYIAPEIQKKLSEGYTLKNAKLPTYTKESDLFALAVHIFTLLMNGCHPFACAKDNTIQQINDSFDKNSVVTPQPIDNIKDGFFPFYHKKEGITYPVYAPSFEALPEKICNLFVRTFTDGYDNPQKRAGTQEWIDTLQECAGVNCSNIIKCVKGHEYFNHNKYCPFCGIEERMRGILILPQNDNLEPLTSYKAGSQTSQQKEQHDSNGIIALVLIFIILFAAVCIKACNGTISQSAITDMTVGELHDEADMLIYK